MPHRRLFLAVLVLAFSFGLIGSGKPVAGSQTPAASSQEPVASSLISRQLAEAEGLRVGDIVTLAATPDGSSPRRFRIAGIYEPVADPMRLAASRFEARLHLPDLLPMVADEADPLSAESVTAVNVALNDPADAQAFAGDVAEKLPIPGLTARSAQGGEEDATVFVVLDRFHLAIAMVTVFASTLFLLALMVMLVDERRESVGVLRLIGLRKSRILLQVFAEGLLVALAGAIFGIFFAAAVQGAVNVFFQWRYDTSLIFVRITPEIALRSALVAVPLGVVASVIASWTLLRSNVLDLARR